MVPKGLPLVHVQDMDLDDRRLENVQGIWYGDRGMSECDPIDRGHVFSCFVNPVDDFISAIALMEPDVVTEFQSNRAAIHFHISKRLMAVDMRLALAKEIEARTVQDLNEAYAFSFRFAMRPYTPPAGAIPQVSCRPDQASESGGHIPRSIFEDTDHFLDNIVVVGVGEIKSAKSKRHDQQSTTP